MRAFGDRLRYVREIVSKRDAVLEFEAELGGIHINGVDLIRRNDAEGHGVPAEGDQPSPPGDGGEATGVEVIRRSTCRR
jgi:hypothetical protein